MCSKLSDSTVIKVHTMIYLAVPFKTKIHVVVSEKHIKHLGL